MKLQLGFCFFGSYGLIHDQNLFLVCFYVHVMMVAGVYLCESECSCKFLFKLHYRINSVVLD